MNPRTLTVDKNAAYPGAAKTMKKKGELWRFTRVHHRKYLNNIVEQDHRRIKRLVRPGLGFQSFHTACRTFAGYESLAMVRKGQITAMTAQATFIANLFDVAAWRCGHRGSPRPPSNFATEPLHLCSSLSLGSCYQGSAALPLRAHARPGTRDCRCPVRWVGRDAVGDDRRTRSRSLADHTRTEA